MSTFFGKIKFFNARTGKGAIIDASGGPVPFDRSQLRPKGSKYIKIGTEVEFKVGYSWNQDIYALCVRPVHASKKEIFESQSSESFDYCRSKKKSRILKPSVKTKKERIAQDRKKKILDSNKNRRSDFESKQLKKEMPLEENKVIKDSVEKLLNSSGSKSSEFESSETLDECEIEEDSSTRSSFEKMGYFNDEQNKILSEVVPQDLKKEENLASWMNQARSTFFDKVKDPEKEVITFERYGRIFNLKNARNLLAEFDDDNDGALNFFEFTKMMMIEKSRRIKADEEIEKDIEELLSESVDESESMHENELMEDSGQSIESSLESITFPDDSGEAVRFSKEEIEHLMNVMPEDLQEKDRLIHWMKKARSVFFDKIKDQDDVISFERYGRIFKIENPHRIFKEFDDDKDGALNFFEFTKMLMIMKSRSARSER